jgi:DNA-binding NarL/FixJ family response regulator
VKEIVKVSKDHDTSILIIDHLEIGGRGLKSALLAAGYQKVRYCLSRDEALLELATSIPDIAILNPLPDLDETLGLIQNVKSHSAHSAIALFAIDTSWALAVNVESAGGSALIKRDVPLATILRAIEELAHNRSEFIYIGSNSATDALAGLTSTEREVLTSISEGLTTREIARQRHNSEATIKSHLTAIYRKLGARNRVEAIAYIHR